MFQTPADGQFIGDPCTSSLKLGATGIAVGSTGPVSFPLSDPLSGSMVDSECFQEAVAKLGGEIPHLTDALVNKYVTDLHQLGLLER